MAGFHDSDYDSDAEAARVAPLPADPFTKAGRKSITQLIAHGETRLTSKIRVRNAAQGGTWAERYICALWANRFQAWRVGILKVNPQSTPSGEEVCRFLSSFVEVYDTYTEKGTLSFDTMVHATKKLKKALTFKYEDFELKPYWRLRIDGVLEQLLEEGLLTREAKRSCEPAGAVVMRRVIESLYENAISAGTSGWNTTLNDVAGLLLLTALGVRAGEILGETNDVRPDLPGLRYSDVKFVVVAGGSIEARFCIRSAKGKKRNGKAFHYVRVNEQLKPQDNVMCPVKLVLILAMRSGNTDGTTLKEIIDEASIRPDKQIVWRFPDRPVICAVAGAGIDWTSLASKQRANRALQKALAAMGIANTVALSPHQTRYGAAHDLTLIESRPTGHSREQISDFLAHGHQSRVRDTAVAYTRSYTAEETWTARVALTEREDKFSELVHQTAPLGPDEQKAQRGRQPLKRAFSALPLEDDHDEAAEEDDSVLAFDVDDVVGTCLEDASKDADAIEMLSEPITSGASNSVDTLSSALTSSREAFVDTFSGVNVVQTTHRGTKGIDYARRCGDDPANTVAAMQRFMLRCKNNANGCQYEAADAVTRDTHEMACRLTSAIDSILEPSAEPKSTKQHACTVSGCEKRYKGERERDDHVADKHTPIKCFVAGCQDTQLYAGRHALLQHVATAHPAKGRLHPTIPDQKDAVFTCLIDGCSRSFHICTSKDVFTTIAYMKHLTKDHGIQDKSARDALRPNWAGNPCFFPDCLSEECFPPNKAGRSAYNAHLRVDHGIEDEAERYEYSYDRVRAYELPRRPEVVENANRLRKAIGTRQRPMVIDDSEEE